MTKTIEMLKQEIRKQSTEQIYDCVITMGGGHVQETERMVRACLIDVYCERTSDEDGDKLMDTIGL